MKDTKWIVDNWREAPKWFSIQALALATALQTAWLFIPPDLKNRVPDNVQDILPYAMLILVTVGRMIPQNLTPPK